MGSPAPALKRGAARCDLQGAFQTSTGCHGASPGQLENGLRVGYGLGAATMTVTVRRTRVPSQQRRSIGNTSRPGAQSQPCPTPAQPETWSLECATRVGAQPAPSRYAISANDGQSTPSVATQVAPARKSYRLPCPHSSIHNKSAKTCCV